jgi:hypothetical protein
MANIKISELRPAGSELFQDSESFLNELNEREMVVGAGDVNVSNISQYSETVGISIVTRSVVTANTFISPKGKGR